jgi:putative MFS transporter
MGLGAVIPIVSTLVTEYSPSRVRGTLSIVINACWGLGGTLAALVGYFIVLEHGWRVAMYMGGFAFLLAVLVRFLLPESTRFLISRGRHAEAQKQFSAIHLDLVDTTPSDESAPLPTSPPLLLREGSGPLPLPASPFHYGFSGLV